MTDPRNNDVGNGSRKHICARSVEHKISDYRNQGWGLGCRSRDLGGTRAIRPCGDFCSVTSAHGGETRLVCTHGYLERLPRMLRTRFRLSHDVWQSHDGRMVQIGDAQKGGEDHMQETHRRCCPLAPLRCTATLTSRASTPLPSPNDVTTSTCTVTIFNLLTYKLYYLKFKTSSPEKYQEPSSKLQTTYTIHNGNVTSQRATT